MNCVWAVFEDNLWYASDESHIVAIFSSELNANLYAKYLQNQNDSKSRISFYVLDLWVDPPHALKAIQKLTS